MKKNILLSSIALLFKATILLAQVPNSSFENLNPDGTLSNWGNVYLFPMHIDSSGSTYVDSLVFDNNWFYAPTNDALGGNKALELRNAWNYTTNTGIAGAVGSDEDSVFSSWGLLNLVPTHGTVFTPFAPFNFGFSYKYFPVNGDSAFAQIALWDSTGNQLAQGELIISSPATGYTPASAPIHYSTAGFAAFYSFSISTFYTLTPGYRQPGFGTRLIVDNIGFNFVSTEVPANIGSEHGVDIYPNPANTEINIIGSQEVPFETEILNAYGKSTIKNQNQNRITVSELPAGIYIAKIKQGATYTIKKFVKL